jgi:hypothetical protein
MFYPEGEYEARMLKEAASQTFKKGAIVVYSSGYVAEAGSDPSYILGVALNAGHNGAAGAYKTLVALAHDSNTFVANVKGSGNANKTAQSDVGAAYGIVSDTNGEWFVDKDDTTNVRVRIIDLVDPAGTENGKVLVKFLSANRYF